MSNTYYTDQAKRRLSVGPAIITEATSTVWIGPGWRAKADEGGNLHLQREVDSP